MKTVSVIAQGLWAKAQSGEFIAADDATPVATKEHSTLVSAINDLFKELRSIRSAWRQAWPDKETYRASKQQWFQAFIEEGVCTQGQIDFGMTQVRKHPGDFIPVQASSSSGVRRGYRPQSGPGGTPSTP